MFVCYHIDIVVSTSKMHESLWCFSIEARNSIYLHTERMNEWKNRRKFKQNIIRVLFGKAHWMWLFYKIYLILKCTCQLLENIVFIYVIQVRRLSWNFVQTSNSLFLSKPRWQRINNIAQTQRWLFNEMNKSPTPRLHTSYKLLYI